MSGRRIGLLAAAAALACGGTVSPLRKTAEIGKEAYVLFTGDGPDGRGDLFAARGDGGEVVQVTFTPVDERAPALSPDGALVAFLRTAHPREPAATGLWVLNLLNGAEREVRLPEGAAPLERVGWSTDGRRLYVLGAGGRIWRADAPPAPPAPLVVEGDAEAAAAESSLAVLLGKPVMARVAPCDAGLCVVTAAGGTTPLPAAARGAARWGADSIAYSIDGRLEIRPLAGGRTHTPEWRDMPAHPREPTYFPGAPGETAGR